MVDDTQYAVFLHENALAALGDAIAPYLTQGPSGPHILCTELDTGGALAEMLVEVAGSDGSLTRTEVMLPVAMIRLILSTGSPGDPFGFHTTVP